MKIAKTVLRSLSLCRTWCKYTSTRRVALFWSSPFPWGGAPGRETRGAPRRKRRATRLSRMRCEIHTCSRPCRRPRTLIDEYGARLVYTVVTQLAHSCTAQMTSTAGGYSWRALRAHSWRTHLGGVHSWEACTAGARADTRVHKHATSALLA